MNKPRKIFDIIPPEKQERKIKTELKKEPAPYPKNFSENKTGRYFFLKKGYFLFVFFVFIFLLFHFVLVRTEIKIWPKMEKADLEENIVLDAQKSEIDVEADSIPGKFFEEEKTVSQDFSATGKATKTELARGKIRVYNNYSTASQPLVANTRFISADGKLFKIIERVVIPGGTYDKGKLQSGWLDVDVVADKPGEDYNIKPNTFSIPGFAGTQKYTSFYGKSFEDMRGGYIGEVSQVTKEDLDNAKKIMESRVLAEGNGDIKNKITAGFIVSDDAIFVEITESTSSASNGGKTENFNYRVSANIKTIAFRDSDLKDISRDFILSKFPAGKKILEESFKIETKNKSADFKNGKIVLEANLSANVYSDINEQKMKEDLEGRTLEEAQHFLSVQPEIAKVQVKSWPFWINKISKDIDKIEIKLVF